MNGNEPQRSRAKLVVGWLLTLACICIILAWVPFSEILKGFAEADWQSLTLAMIPVFINVGLRGLRLVTLAGVQGNQNLINASAICAAGLGANAIGPARVGEAVRLGLITHFLRRDFGEAVSLLITERTLDLIALVLLGAASLAWSTQNATLPAAEVRNLCSMMTLMTSALIVGTAIILIALTLPLESYGERRPHKRENILTRVVFTWILDRLIAGQAGFQKYVAVPVLVRASLISVAMWLALGISIYLVGAGFNALGLTFASSLAIAALTTIASAVPSAPGSWGIYEISGVALAIILIPDASPGLLAAFIIATHAVQYFPVVTLGLISSIFLGARARQATSSA